jgi:hypothetical protein
MLEMTEKEAGRFVEKVRKLYSSDEGHQHLLDTIADDIAEEFGTDVITCAPAITAFVRQWKP